MYNKKNSGHDDSLQKGHEFQDFVCMELAKRGIILQNIQSRKYQYAIGENLQGFEIKYDARCTGCPKDPKKGKPTGRLSIEIAEKSDAANPEYVKSGIYAKSNSWLYIQGNYNGIWIFSTKHLRMLHERKKEHEIYSLPTIVKYYIPLDYADKICLIRIDFDGSKLPDQKAVDDYIYRSKEIYKQLQMFS